MGFRKLAPGRILAGGGGAAAGKREFADMKVNLTRADRFPREIPLIPEGTLRVEGALDSESGHLGF